MYSIIKHLHMLLAVISILGFITRGILKFRNSSLLNRKWIKITPHVIDTFLLCFGVYLAISIGANLGNSPWIIAKVIGLIAYIGFGLITLRFAKSTQTRVIAFILAIASFIYILLVARAHSPMPF